MALGFLNKRTTQSQPELFDYNHFSTALKVVRKSSYAEQVEEALAKFANRVNSFRNLSLDTRSRIMLLVNAIASGELKPIEALVKSYERQPELLAEDMPILAYVFEQQNVMFLETTVYRYEGRNQKVPTAANLMIEVRSIKRAICISTHPNIESTVHQAFRRENGRISLLPADGEDPTFVMKRVGVAACSQKDVPTLPPMFAAAN